MVLFTTATVKEVVLFGQLVVLLIAFSSIYWQIPGLAGERGLIPVAAKLQCEDLLLCQCAAIVFLHTRLSLAPSVALQLIALAGIVLSSMAILLPRMRHIVVFITLYVFYYSIVESMDTFLHFQWDSLLLESTLYAGIVANFADGDFDQISLYYCSAMAFRLMFSSGIVKLLSGCPTWWNLSALTIHYESQCLPTPLAWYFHHLPVWFHRVSVSMTYYIEIFLPPLFLLPFRNARIFAFFGQVVLMVMIMLSGNYNFFNFNYLVMCFSVLQEFNGTNTGLLSWSLSFSAILMVSYLFITYFPIAVDVNKMELVTRVAFAQKNLNDLVYWAVVWFLIIYVIVYLMYLVDACKKTFRNPQLSLWDAYGYYIAIAIGGCLFWLGMVPLASLNKEALKLLPKTLIEVYPHTTRFHLANSYGLFRRMTGVDGRPEIIVEGSTSLEGPWTEIKFYAKPGNISEPPIFVLPHQPRLDWQMWFAALGSYQRTPFFLSLVHHLLENTTDVMRLLADFRFQAPTKPINYIRADLYTYRFSGKDEKRDWWNRTKQEEYMPIFGRKNPVLVDYLVQEGLLLRDPDVYTKNTGEFDKFLRSIHRQVQFFDQSEFVWIVLATIISIHNCAFFLRRKFSVRV